MILERLSSPIMLFTIDKPREVRFGGYPEKCTQISGIMFDMNYKEPRIGDAVAWETLRITWMVDKVMDRYCLKKV